MQIWPAIDIRGGKCVRLAQGDYQQETVYGNDPADMAMRFVAEGATGLHIVDLDGARDGLTSEGTSPNREAISRIAQETDIDLQIGGGIRDERIIDDYLSMGIKRLVIGTKSLTDPDWVKEMIAKYPSVLIIGIDARNGRVATDGWIKTSDTTAIDHAQQFAHHPIAGIVYTDISKDGMLTGPNFDAMSEMRSAVDIPVIASGGITTVDDIAKLSSFQMAGAIVGRTFYEGRMTLTEALTAAAAPV